MFKLFAIKLLEASGLVLLVKLSEVLSTRATIRVYARHMHWLE